MYWAFDKKHKILGILCLIYGIWHFGTNWTTTLVSFLQWDTIEVLSIVDLSYIQAFGSLCNALGSLAIGQAISSNLQFDKFLLTADRFNWPQVDVHFFDRSHILLLRRTRFLPNMVPFLLPSGGCLQKAFPPSIINVLLEQILRVGYQLDSTAEMYLATVTTERERTGALMILTIPQAISMFFAPIIGSKIAVYTTLRLSQIINGCVMAALLIPVLVFFLPTTHSVPRLATARLRPQAILFYY